MAGRYNSLIQNLNVGANASMDFNIALGRDRCNVFQLRVVPSIAGGTFQVLFYDSDSFADANLIYASDVIAGPYYDPVHVDAAGNVTFREGLRAFLFPYDDVDASNEIHVRIVNNDTQAKMFALTIVYEPVN